VLSVSNQELSRLNTFEKSQLDFILNDYLLEAEEDKTFTLRADIKSARTRDQVRLYLDAPEHIHALDLDLGFGAQVDNQFGRDQAKCLGSEDTNCPSPGLRIHCSEDDVEAGVIDC